MLLYALLSLTAARMVPIAIALLGKGLRRSTRLFLGWFGPRGLASIVLATIVVDQLIDIPHGKVIVTVVTLTVSLSVFLHGVSAIPLLSWYGRRMDSLGPDSPEKRPVAEFPYRFEWSPFSAVTDQRVTQWEDQRSSKSNADKKH
jgi:NhaP-type Na+/H+ or K+/H+ antiporter